MSPVFKNLLVWALMFMAMMMLFSQFRSSGNERVISYSDFMNRAEQGEFDLIKVDGQKLIARDGNNQMIVTHSPPDVFMIPDLRKAGVEIQAEPEEERSFLLTLFISWAPMLLLIGVWLFFMRQMQGGRGGAFSFGKNKARILSEEENTVTFKDVAGCDEAKDEVGEIVDFLRHPNKFRKLGAKIPRGVLMVGNPGTGKTLLARAIAGEAGVPFYSVSGSDFVEMFVGVGAARVRDMFEQAKKNEACIVFIDEIDAVGRQRGTGLGGGNDEREQTLNQLLVEMDGFEENHNTIVIAATNRPDVLDPALLRPGRFDRQVVVPLPDIRGRAAILEVHMRKVPVSPDVDANVIARGTPGFAGADLANLVNEACLRAGQKKSRQVFMKHFEYAKEKIIMGAERRSVLMPKHERLNTAYHESGHVIVARLLDHTDPVHKVTIIPRGQALGVTMQLPVEDRYSMTNKQIIDNICVLLAGRAAEELFMQHMTTGASNDFERATNMSRRMVTQWGMTSMGTMVYGEEEGEIFLGRSVTTHKQVSEVTMREVDTEIRKIIDEQYNKAVQLLSENREKVEIMTKALLDWETIDAVQINQIMNGEQPVPPDDLPPTTGDSDASSPKKGSGGKKKKTVISGEEAEAA